MPINETTRVAMYCEVGGSCRWRGGCRMYPQVPRSFPSKVLAPLASPIRRPGRSAVSWHLYLTGGCGRLGQGRAASELPALNLASRYIKQRAPRSRGPFRDGVSPWFVAASTHQADRCCLDAVLRYGSTRAPSSLEKGDNFHGAGILGVISNSFARGWRWPFDASSTTYHGHTRTHTHTHTKDGEHLRLFQASPGAQLSSVDPEKLSRHTSQERLSPYPVSSLGSALVNGSSQLEYEKGGGTCRT
jgi:hypothetical protein